MRNNYCMLRRQALAVTLGAALIALPAFAVRAEDSIQTARATITIPSPRSANLLQLRGIGGRGTALLQIGGTCHSMPVRLVAGDFEGRQTNLRDQGAIVLEFRDPKLVRALSQGADIVSDEAIVSADSTDHDAGILILSGLDAGTGFVINPGRTFAADIFGARRSTISCKELGQTQASTPKG